MSWSVEYSKGADKFLAKNPNSSDALKDELKKLIQHLRGETVSIDIRKLYGKWAGYYRIRKGKIRIILSFDKDEQSIYVDTIDFRGDVY